jgi:glyoxylase-like metal-dependent hydrolase (beta-lactamase superfamily II)
MRKTSLLASTCVMALAMTVAAQQGALQTAATTLGVANIKTLEFTGTGQMFSVGQNYVASDPWPAVPLKNYTVTINYDTAAMRVDLVRTMGPLMPRGGGAPFTGDQRQTQLVSGNYAWNMPAPAANAAAGAPAPQAAPQAAAQVERMLALWATPQGFVKAAMANNATTRQVRGGTEVSFTVGGKYKMVGTINGQGQVEKVQTWVDQSIVGDMLIETTYSGYRSFGGVTFPSRIVQTQDGYPSLDLTISSVTANPMFDAAVPDNVRNAPPPAAPMVAVEKLAEGVFYLTGGTHHSLAIEMRDHIVVVDTPQNEARAAAVLAKAKETIPNKPIRYVVTSHHHWDHLGGIRTAIDEGATIVTHNSNKSFLERIAKTPHTLGPDRLAASRKAVRIMTIGDRGQLTDGTRTIELHRLQNFEHTGDLLVVYLPKEGIIAEPDSYTPPAQPTGTLIAPAVPFAKALYDHIQRNKLNVQVIVPFHGNRKSDVAELARLAGVNATN